MPEQAEIVSKIADIVAKKLGERDNKTMAATDVALDESVVAEVETKVKEIICEQMNVNEGDLTLETAFVQDLNADSLDVVELVMEFEDAFEISIPDDEAEKILTVGEAIGHIVILKSEL